MISHPPRSARSNPARGSRPFDFAHALLAGRELERITIRGAGVIDMNRDRRYGPKPIALERCRFVTVQGITIVRSPNYCVSLGGCEDVLIEGVTIRDAFSDGIDPDCCRRVRIANCDIESDDDALCLKASFFLGVRGATGGRGGDQLPDAQLLQLLQARHRKHGRLPADRTLRLRVRRHAPADRDASAAAEGGGIALLMVDGGTIDG
jgi:hypothetical protein